MKAAPLPFPWPATVNGHALKLGPFDTCAACGIGSWVRYGGVVTCLGCVRGRPVAEIQQGGAHESLGTDGPLSPTIG